MIPVSSRMSRSTRNTTRGHTQTDLTIAMGGDWFARGRIPRAVRSRAGTTKLLRIFRDADIAFVNLEAPLTRRGSPAEKQNTLRAIPNLVDDLTAAGVDIASIANNHMLDYGPLGLVDTIRALRGRRIAYVGAGADLRRARAGVTFHRKSTRVGFIGFAATLPQGFSATNDRPGVSPLHVSVGVIAEGYLVLEQPGTPPPMLTIASESDLADICYRIGELKRRVDFVVVSAHWGVAGQDTIMDYQRESARALIRAGADLILGHHPHRLHAIEHYRGKFIFYSIGNLVFEPLPAVGNHPELSYRGRNTAASVYALMRREGVIVVVRLRRGRIVDIDLRPVELDLDGYPETAPDAAARVSTLLNDLPARDAVKTHPRGDGTIALGVDRSPRTATGRAR